MNFKSLNIKKNNLIYFILSRIKIKFLITLTCLAFIGNSIYLNFESLSNETVAFLDLLWLFSGFLLTSLSVVINGFAWKLLINNICGNNNKLDKLDILKLFLATNIYKYLPGGVWHFVSRYRNLRLKFPNEKTIQSILLEPLLMLVAGLFYLPLGGSNIIFYVLCWSSPLAFLPALRKFIIKKLKSMKANIFTNSNELKVNNSLSKDQNISKNISYPYKPLFVEILFILFRFLGFLCCVNAFSIGSLIPLGVLISSFSLAWIIGLIVPAAPGGVGVFEFVVIFTIGSQLPEAALLASLLCYRLISTISDVFTALIYPVKKLIDELNFC